ncbi:MAG TPA: enoyl-CoA hydratase/isomerase family protein, partial [Acidimicrobiales bacterium]
MNVTCEVTDRIAVVTLSDPATHNALDEAGVQGLAEAWTRIRDDDEILVAVLRGDGDRAFSSGANLKTLLPVLTAGGLPEIVAPDGPVFAKFVLAKPVVAAVRGICVAGGTELLQATDIRIASHDARFGLPEPRWGLLPVGGSTVRLARQIPYCHAMELLLTGDMIDAETALRIGLVNRLVDSAE